MRPMDSTATPGAEPTTASSSTGQKLMTVDDKHHPTQRQQTEHSEKHETPAKPLFKPLHRVFCHRQKESG